MCLKLLDSLGRPCADSRGLPLGHQGRSRPMKPVERLLAQVVISGGKKHTFRLGEGVNTTPKMP